MLPDIPEEITAYILMASKCGFLDREGALL
jgi:hypothetical protein